MKRKNLSFGLCVCASLVLAASCASLSGGKSTALIDAVKANNIPLVKELIASGEDVNARDSDGNVALRYAALNDSLEMTKLLLDAGANPSIGYALTVACGRGNMEIARTLLEAGADPNDFDKMGGSLLIGASALELTEIVRLLLAFGANTDMQDIIGNTALMAATHRGNAEIARILIDAGANLDLQDRNGETALMHAVMDENARIVRLLLEGGANPNVQNEDGETALMAATYRGNAEIARILIEGGANPNVLNNYGETALMNAVMDENAEIVRLLLEGGANPDIQDEDGWTALMVAVTDGNSEIARLIIDAGANLDVQYEDGDTVLMHAVMDGNAEIARLLIKGGANPNVQNNDGETVLMYAAGVENAEIVRLLLAANANPNIQDAGGGITALMIAVGLVENPEIVRLLLESGANPNIQDEDGWTALMVAVMDENAEIVRLLLEGGANPDIQDEDGWTALMVAVTDENAEIARLLLDAGANPDIQDYVYASTALSIAEFVGNAEIIRMLSADEFTDMVQALAVKAASLGTYDATRVSVDYEIKNYYTPQIWAERFAAEYGSIAGYRTFLGVCHDYAVTAYNDIQANQRKYNVAGMNGDQFYKVNVHDNPGLLELEKIAPPGNGTVTYTSGVTVRRYGTRNILTHKEWDNERASNHAWIWIQRDDGVWFWVDPTWTDNLGWVVWGCISNGEEILLKPDTKFCVKWNSKYLDNRPDPPPLGPKIQPAYVAQTQQPSTSHPTSSSSPSSSPLSSSYSSFSLYKWGISVGVSAPVSGMIGDDSSGNIGFSVSLESGDGPFLFLLQGDYYAFETQSLLASIALGKQFANIFGIYAGGGLGSGTHSGDFEDSYLAWKVFGGARLMLGPISLRADVSYVRDTGIVLGAHAGIMF